MTKKVELIANATLKGEYGKVDRDEKFKCDPGIAEKLLKSGAARKGGKNPQVDLVDPNHSTQLKKGSKKANKKAAPAENKAA